MSLIRLLRPSPCGWTQRESLLWNCFFYVHTIAAGASYAKPLPISVERVSCKLLVLAVHRGGVRASFDALLFASAVIRVEAFLASLGANTRHSIQTEWLRYVTALLERSVRFGLAMQREYTGVYPIHLELTVMKMLFEARLCHWSIESKLRSMTG